MKKIKELIFGKEKSFSDEILSQFTCRVKNENYSKSYTWTSELIIENQKKDMTIILEGNANGPYKKQLSEAQKIIKNLESISQQIDIKLKDQKFNITDHLKDWQKIFFLSAILPTDLQSNTFELNYENVMGGKPETFSFIWRDNKICEFEIN